MWIPSSPGLGSEHFHVPLRSGTDIAFMAAGQYILDNNLYFNEYVAEYTNSAFIVGEKYRSRMACSRATTRPRKYDKIQWAFGRRERRTQAGPVV
jgi:formate dehydrogenase major subunit